jgi:hypothetical protein
MNAIEAKDFRKKYSKVKRHHEKSTFKLEKDIENTNKAQDFIKIYSRVKRHHEKSMYSLEKDIENNFTKRYNLKLEEFYLKLISQLRHKTWNLHQELDI